MISVIRAAPCASSVWIGTCQPWKERDGMPHFAEHDGHQPGGHLLARRDDRVIFPRIMEF